MVSKLESKADFQALLRRILEPLKPYYSQSGALLDLGKTSAHYPDRVAMFEAFARPLWGLVPFWKGGGTDTEFADLYKRGLSAGTNLSHDDYWDGSGEVNQRYVEMAAIAMGLLVTPEILWEPLTGAEKANLAAWLGKINTINTHSYPDCNWWFFLILTNAALKKLGFPHDDSLVEYAFSRIEEFYLGGGWYQDGMTGRKDYYISFAIHFYSLIYSVEAQNDEAERCRIFKERAESFAADFIYWFDDTGQAVPYGRSLTYRFSQAAFWSAYVYAGLGAIPLGVVKGILSRHLLDWMSAPIFDRDGILTIGYRYPNLRMAETYNAPGSPYWAMKTFLILALPDAHPFWQAEAEPMPPLDGLKHFPDAGMIIQRNSGHTVMYPSAVFRNDDFGHMPEKYGKFAYSSKYGFSVAVSNGNLELCAPDSMLAFEISGYIFTRRTADSSAVENNQVRSVWSPIAGIIVETVVIPAEGGHIRKHTVTNSLLECIAYDCGFAIPAPSPAGYAAKAEGGQASARCGEAPCSVSSETGTGRVITAAPNTNLVNSKTVIPSVRYHIPLGVTVLQTKVSYE